MDEKDLNDFIDLAMKAAQTRGDVEVSQESIKKALEMIRSGERNVAFYPMGLPSLKDVYSVALELTSGH